MGKVNNARIKKIAKEYFRASRQRNFFVILAIILATFLMVTVYSIGLNFYDATKQQQTLSEGTNRDIIVTDPTEAQINRAKSLEQCMYVGTEARCGIAQECNGEKVTYRILWKDTVIWEKQTSQGIQNVVGKYPQDEDEIMMSEWMLQEMGITEYELGMEIPVKYSIEKEPYEKIFRLSGYYTDYMALLNPGAEAFLVSKTFYNNALKTMASPTIEMDITLDSRIISENQIKDIERELDLTKSQGFFYNEELINITKLLVLAVALVSLLIMFCSYLLIYNILYISFSKDVQTYGLLKTLGMTNRQMKYMLRRQVLFMAVIGISIGEILGALTAVAVVPTIMTKIFSGNNLLIDRGIRVEIFIFAAFFILATVLISSLKPVKNVAKISPLSAVRYEGVTVKRKIKKGNRGAKPYRMAIYNVLCNKRKMITVYLSLFVGLTMFLVINIYTNSINKKDYVNAYMPTDAILRNPTRNDSGNLGEQIFDESILRQIESIEGVEHIEIVTSDTINIGFDEEIFSDYLREFCELWMNESYEDVLQRIKAEPLDFYGCLIGVSDDQLQELKLTEDINISDFKNGKTCIIQTDIPIEKIKNKNVSFNIAGNDKKYSLKVAGIAKENLSAYSGIAPNIYVSNNVLNQFVESPWIERIDVTYNQSYDKEVENKLNTVISDTGAEMSSRIKMEENIGNFKDQLNILGNGLAGIIAVIGVLNFVNVIITNICERKQEFIILNRIGMTWKQIRKMLIYEGLVYGLGTVILVSTLGVFLGLLIFSVVKEPYMVFHFPYIPVMIVFIVLIMICIIVPILIEKKVLESKYVTNDVSNAI